MSVEYYKKQLIDLRARLAKEREAKKKDNARYATSIKSTKVASTDIDSPRLNKNTMTVRQPISGIFHITSSSFHWQALPWHSLSAF